MSDPPTTPSEDNAVLMAAAISLNGKLRIAHDLLCRMRAQHHRTGSYAAAPLLDEVDNFLAALPDTNKN